MVTYTRTVHSTAREHIGSCVVSYMTASQILVSSGPMAFVIKCRKNSDSVLWRVTVSDVNIIK